MNNWFTLQDLIVVSPIIVLLAFSLLPLFIKVFRGNREPSAFITLAYNVMGLLAATGLTAALAGAKKTAFSGALVFDGIAIWMSCLIYVIAAFGLMISFDHVATRGRQFTEYCFLLVSSTIGMIILLMANDLTITFIGIETMSLCLYVLTAMSHEAVLSKEAAFKYFVLGSFSSAVFLYGMALVYGTAGGTSFAVLAQATPNLIATNRVFLAGIGLLVMGFAFKVSLFPLHSWTPDVYQGAATPVTAFMSTASKAATFIAFLRLFNSEGFQLSGNLLTVVSWLAVLTMTVGNVAAVLQSNFKRVLAYSSVAHSGYAMVGLIAAGFGTNYNFAASSLLFYLFSYSVMTVGSFALIALFEKKESTLLAVDDLKGLARKYPGLALSLTILMLSLAGIPPTLGFFSKFYIFSAALDQDMYWLALWGVLNSVVSVYYYLRPVVVMYMSDDQPIEAAGMHFMTRATVIISALLIVVMGIAASPVLRAVQRSVLNLF